MDFSSRTNPPRTFASHNVPPQPEWSTLTLQAIFRSSTSRMLEQSLAIVPPATRGTASKQGPTRLDSRSCDSTTNGAYSSTTTMEFSTQQYIGTGKSAMHSITHSLCVIRGESGNFSGTGIFSRFRGLFGQDVLFTLT